MIGNPRQHRDQQSLWIDSVQFRRLDQAVHRRGMLAAIIRPREQVILPSNRDGSQRSLCRVVVDLPVAVTRVAQQRWRRSTSHTTRRSVPARPQQSAINRLNPSFGIDPVNPASASACRTP